MKKTTKTMILVKIMRNAKESGTNTDQSKTMDFANLVSNQKMKKRNKSSWTRTDIIFMIANLLIVEKT